MILIKSSRSDFSTTHVIKWLQYLKKDFIRVNEERIESFNLHSGQGFSIRLENGLEVALDQISNYWYRRGIWAFADKLKPVNPTDKIEKALRQQNRSDKKSLLAYLNEYLKERGNFSDQFSATHANKMLQLHFAAQVGLKVPPFLLSGERAAVLQFQEKHHDIITKVIDAPIFFLTEETSLPTYTTKVERAHILDLPEHFSPSVFQKMIPKKCEIRSFFMDDTFYSMAIFSQGDDQTKVDFRKYNWKKPNRNVPFQLPESIQDQLRALMKKLDMYSGSFDIILTPEGEYVFLEVNPVGQFGMVSIPCNYYLEKKIAEFLSRNN